MMHTDQLYLTPLVAVSEALTNTPEINKFSRLNIIIYFQYCVPFVC